MAAGPCRHDEVVILSVDEGRQAAAVRLAGMLALGIFLLLLLTGRGIDLLGSTPRIFLVLAWPLVLALQWWTGRPLPTVLYIVGGGLLLRMWEFPGDGAGPSDALAAVYESIAVFLRGENPYDHVYEMTRPPGAPVPYPPAMMLIHLPGYLLDGMVGVQLTQVVAAAGTMLAFVILGARVSWLAALPALAAYAGASNLVGLAIDGSNDTAVGLALLLAALALAWAIGRGLDWPALVVAGVAAGVVLGMKQSAAPLVLVLGAYLFQRHGAAALARYAAGAGGFLLLISLPFLLDPLAYARGLLSFIGAHDDLYGWNIWTFARGMGWPVWEEGQATMLNLAASAIALGAGVLLPYRRLTGAVLAGLIVTLIVLLTARWTTYAYFAMIAPVALLLPALAAWEARRAGIPAADSELSPDPEAAWVSTRATDGHHRG